MSDDRSPLSGLTPKEAKEFHKYMVQGTVGFIALTLVAHILIWMWRPWF